MNRGLYGRSGPRRAVGPTVVNTLLADVSISDTYNTAGVYHNGPTVVLTPGTWLLCGQILYEHQSAATDFSVILWDGTTKFATYEIAVGNTGLYGVALSAVVTPLVTTSYSIAGAVWHVQPGRIRSNINLFGAPGGASVLNAVKLA